VGVVAQRQRCLPLSLIYARGLGETATGRWSGRTAHAARGGHWGHRSLAPSDASVDRSGGARYHSHSPRPRPRRRGVRTMYTARTVYKHFPDSPWITVAEHAANTMPRAWLVLSLSTWTILQTVTLCSVPFSSSQMFLSKSFDVPHMYTIDPSLI